MSLSLALSAGATSPARYPLKFMRCFGKNPGEFRFVWFVGFWGGGPLRSLGHGMARPGTGTTPERAALDIGRESPARHRPESMGGAGIEPARTRGPWDFKSHASASSATRPCGAPAHGATEKGSKSMEKIAILERRTQRLSARNQGSAAMILISSRRRETCAR